MDNDDKNGITPPKTAEEQRNDDFINVFSYFEESNATNRAAFAELLNYTYRNRRDPR